MLSSLNFINLLWYFFNQRKSLEFWSFLINIRSSTNSFCHLLVAISVTCYIKSSFHGWLHAELNDNLINISFSDMLLLWSIWNNIRRGLTSEWPFDKLIKLWENCQKNLSLYQHLYMVVTLSREVLTPGNPGKCNVATSA